MTLKDTASPHAAADIKSSRSIIFDYLALTKPIVVALLLTTTLAAMIVAA
jgi:heme O synthase-like polyprenyltransferase